MAILNANLIVCRAVAESADGGIYAVFPGKRFQKYDLVLANLRQILFRRMVAQYLKGQRDRVPVEQDQRGRPRGFNQKVNILLVDDQPAKLLSYEAILGELGENLIKAASGTEALEHLLKSNIAEARRNLNASLAKGVTDDGQIEMARIDALTGNTDAAREQVKEILSRNPNLLIQ